MVVRALGLLAGALALTLPGIAHADCKVGMIAELAVTMQGRTPLVDATINAHPVRFIADSGAFYSTISHALATELKLPKRPAPPGFELRGIGGAAEAGVTSVRNFGVADAELHDIEFVVGGSDTGTAGLLGQNVLGVGDVEYDLAHGAIRLMKPQGCDRLGMAYWAGERPFTMVPIETLQQARFHTIGTATVNNIKLRVLFDTGASNSIISRDAAKRMGITPDSPGVVSGGFAHGLGSHTIPSWVVPIDSIDIGGEILKHAKLRMQELDGDFDMIAGIDFFLSHRVFVANSQHRMYLTYEGGPVFGITPTRAVTPQGQVIAMNDVVAEPTDAAGYSQRGAAFASKHDFAKAMADIDKAVGMAPDVARYWQQRGDIGLAQGHPLEAIKDYDKAVALTPADAELRIRHAQLSRRLGNFSQATDDARAADAALAPTAQARLALAGLFDSLDMPDRALASYDLWLRSHGEDALRATAYNGRCWTRAQLNRDLGPALDDCNTALKLRPNIAGYLDSRGLVYLRRENFAKAIADYSAALAINPNQAWTRYQRGIAEQRAGLAEAARADLTAATSADPKVVERAHRMGLVTS